MDRSARFCLNGPRIVHEAFEHEVVAVNLDTGRYYCLRHSGADAWHLMLEQRSLEEIAARLAARYDASEETIAGELDRLFGELVEQSLVIAGPPGSIAGPGPVAHEEARASRGPFVPPALEVYTDMQDLLLLDPIHEVDPAGWPVASREEPQPR